MFLLHFVPDSLLSWIVNTTLIAGIVGFTASFFFGIVLKYVPSVAPYRMMIQLVSIVLLVAGVYFKGGYSVELEWRARVADAQKKVEIAEAKSAQANADLIEEQQKKQKVIHDTKVVVQQKVVQVASKIDSDCKITKETIDILNEAAGVSK